jgi:hypothetical protein
MTPVSGGKSRAHAGIKTMPSPSQIATELIM